MQPGSHHGTGGGRAHDGIAVIEQGVDAVAVLIAAELAAKQQAPVAACALAFDVVGITAFDFTYQRGQRGSGRACGLQRGGLLLQLGFN